NSPVYSENVLSFGVAYGLALQGLGVTRLRTNLLPQEIQFDRMIRAKKPWAAAAAASLLLGIAVFHSAASSQYQTYDAAAKEADVAKKVVDKDAQGKATFAQKQKELRDARDKAAKILRGGEERTNWSILHRYINDCLPQPNGNNVPHYPLQFLNPVVVPYDKYYNDAAKRAFETKRDRDQEGKLDEIDYSNLIQINIQAIYARYCDIPMAQNFYEYVRNNCQLKDSL